MGNDNEELLTTVKISEEHVQYASENGVTGLIAATWKNQFSEKERQEIIDLNLNGKLKTLLEINDSTERKKFLADIKKEKDEEQKTKSIQASNVKPVQAAKISVAQRMVMQTLLLEIFGISMISQDNTKIAEKIKNHSAAVLEDFMRVFSALLKVVEPEKVEAILKLGINYALAPLFGTKYVSNKKVPQEIETYARVIKLQYQNALKFPPDSSEEDLHKQLKEKIIVSASSTMASTVGGSAEDYKEEAEACFDPAVRELKLLLEEKES